MHQFISNKLKSQFQKILVITIAWTLISFSQFLLGYNTLLQFNCNLEGIKVMDFIKGNLFVGVLAGLLGGSLIVFLWERWLRILTYGRMLLLIFLSYTVIFFIISIISGLYSNSLQLDLPMFDAEAIRASIEELFQLRELYSYTFWLIIIIVTAISLQVNDKYGPGVFKDFLLGKYFHPRREERIFMFLDMRSSTTIAEKLGEEKYFSLVRELFSIATAPIIYSKGEIYQYVGDEIIISWKMKNGLERANCLNCFFEIQKKLLENKTVFIKRYGLMPEFKAGLHYGFVMAGEVGVVKRDIAFSGDVLNTAARIQGKCNEMGVDILLSKKLLDKLKLPANLFKPKQVGNILLRGKQEKLTLFTIYSNLH